MLYTIQLNGSNKNKQYLLEKCFEWHSISQQLWNFRWRANFDELNYIFVVTQSLVLNFNRWSFLNELMLLIYACYAFAHIVRAMFVITRKWWCWYWCSCVLFFECTDKRFFQTIRKESNKFMSLVLCTHSLTDGLKSNE